MKIITLNAYVENLRMLKFLYVFILVLIMMFISFLMAGKTARAQTTSRVSIDSNENQATGGDSKNAVITDDGRYIVFESKATDLVAGDTNTKSDVFLRDLTAGTTTRISVDSSEAEADGDSKFPFISLNGQFVVFESKATNLVAGDTNDVGDVFLHIFPPTITNFNPNSGGTGTSITITGTNFTGATAVKFGGTDAQSFNVDSPNQITAQVAGGSTGKVRSQQ